MRGGQDVACSARAATVPSTQLGQALVRHRHKPDGRRRAPRGRPGHSQSLGAPRQPGLLHPVHWVQQAYNDRCRRRGLSKSHRSRQRTRLQPSGRTSCWIQIKQCQLDLQQTPATLAGTSGRMYCLPVNRLDGRTSPYGDGPMPGHGQALTWNGVPSGNCSARVRIVLLSRRRQPLLTGRPMLAGSFVPCRPIWPRPPLPKLVTTSL